MNKNNLVSLIALSLLFLLFLYCIPKNSYIRQQLDSYAQQIAEQQFGSMVLTPEYEEKIVAIAQEMKVTEPFIIRKMNYQALSLFGYYNAFTYFPLLFNCIPIGNQAFFLVLL